MPTDSKIKISKSVEKQPASTSDLVSPPGLNISQTVESKTTKDASTEVLSFCVKKKSLRARPDNPTKYKALRPANIRSGKSVRTDIIGKISKGSVVVINQIKGRSGRIVVPQDHGDFTKVG